MNNAMGIKQDKDIITAQLASAEEAEEYEVEEDDAPAQPTLDPMRPFLPRAESSWNKQLWSLLVAYLSRMHEFDLCTLEEMETAFYHRLKCLHRLHKSSAPSGQEDYEEFEEQREQTARNTRQRQRVHTRRGTVRFTPFLNVTSLSRSPIAI